jgi:hypothetical protein
MLSVFDPLARAISDWQRKHHIADGDPMIAAVELVRIYLKHSGETDNDPTASPPGFEDFAAPSNCSTAVRKHSSIKLRISSVSAPVWPERQSHQPSTVRAASAAAATSPQPVSFTLLNEAALRRPFVIAPGTQRTTERSP